MATTIIPIEFIDLSKVRAGFPSPAGDFLIKRIDLNELLITQPAATFLWRVAGSSMVEAGIHDGSFVLVNRALTARHGCIVVAQVDNEFTVKYFHRVGQKIKLVPANPTYPEICFQEGQTMSICGVVTAAITRFV